MFREKDIYGHGGYGVVQHTIDDYAEIPQLNRQESVDLGTEISELRKSIGSKLITAVGRGKTVIPDHLKADFEKFLSLSNRLAEGNLKLVHYSLKIFPLTPVLNKCELADILCSTQEELVKRARDYNPWLGIKEGDVKYKTILPLNFSSYFLRYIRYYQFEELWKSYNIYIPNERRIMLAAFNKAKASIGAGNTTRDREAAIVYAELTRKLNRPPTREEIGYYYLTLEDGSGHEMNHEHTLREYEMLLLMSDTVSLEKKFARKKQERDHYGEVCHPTTSFQDVLQAPDNVEEEADKRILKTEIANVLDTLSPKYALMIRMYYMSNGKYNLRDIAREFNITQERVRQCLKAALKHLRHPKNIRLLVDYIE